MDNISGQEQGWLTARMLAEALPFIQTYNPSVVVIKHGGYVMDDPDVAKQFAADCVPIKMLRTSPGDCAWRWPADFCCLETPGR